MSIFARMKNILSSNVNDALDRMEDPSKMVDQAMRQMATDLAEVKKATAEVMAQETKAQRRVDEQRKEIEKFTDLAKKAAKANNIDHARTFLAKKNELEADMVPMEEQLLITKKNAAEVRQAHDKLVTDMQAMQKRKANIKADVAIAKAQETVAGTLNKTGRRGESASAAFDRLEEKAKSRRDAANAMNTLNTPPECDATALKNLYGSGGGFALESELEALMASQGNPVSAENTMECEISALLASVENDNAN